MNLAEFKGLLIEAGVDYLNDSVLRSFINSGQRLLDRLCDFPHQQGKLSFNVAANQYFLVFPTRIRIVHGAWCDGERMEKLDLIVLRGLYPDTSTTGTPAYYAHTTSILASYGSPLVSELAIPTDNVPIATDDPYDYKGIIIAPTPDQSYAIEVLATAYTKELVADTDMSFWTKHYPDVLFNAVMFKIEGFLRNSASAQNYLQAVMNDVRYLNYDSVEDELQDRPNLMGE